jgi:hypothetical protein
VHEDLLEKTTSPEGLTVQSPEGLLAHKLRVSVCAFLPAPKGPPSSCESRSQRRPSPRLSASRGPPFIALSRQGGYAHILKGYFYTNLVGTLEKGKFRKPGGGKESALKLRIYGHVGSQIQVPLGITAFFGITTTPSRI